jgi:hypothetical protein
MTLVKRRSRARRRGQEHTQQQGRNEAQDHDENESGQTRGYSTHF